MKFVGKLYDMKVYSADWVDKDTVYLINPKNLHVEVEMKNMKQLTLIEKVSHYLKTLLLAAGALLLIGVSMAAMWLLGKLAEWVYEEFR